jgi:nucleotide-binding universal stress UspA family protein
MILIAYDATESSDHAIDVAAALFPGARAHVLYVWQPVASSVEPFTLAAAASLSPGELTDELSRARGVADAGAGRAQAAGLDADGEAVESVGSAAGVIEAAIDRLRPQLVVIGSRGLTGLAALLKGSVSRHVSAHAHVPVLVVPPPAAAPLN